MAVDIRLTDVTDLKGYGVELQYDPNVHIPQTGDRAADLFAVLDHNPETGQLYIASSVTQGNPVSGGGTLATLTFKLIDLFTPDFSANLASNLGDRFSIMPTEYALDHNFPNRQLEWQRCPKPHRCQRHLPLPHPGRQLQPDTQNALAQIEHFKHQKKKGEANQMASLFSI